MADAQGLLKFPYDAAWLSENPEVLFNLPPDQTLSLALSVLPRLPHSPQLDYAECMGGVPQAKQLMREQAGTLSIFLPSMKGLLLH